VSGNRHHHVRHHAIEGYCKAGVFEYREPSAGLLQAWGDAVADEDCARACGVVYRGALARAVHVMCAQEVEVEV